MINKTLVLATGNQGKVEEMRRLLQGIVEVKSMREFPGCPEVVEDGVTFTENAVKKAETISRFLQLPALADDSGLEVDALEGRPGVYSARFSGPNATDKENNDKLIGCLHDVPPGERSARFRCVLALAVPGRDTWTCEGTCEGQMLLEPQGEYGFGYDPLFFLPELNKTMGQLTKEEKNKISHRGLAMQILLERIHELL